MIFVLWQKKLNICWKIVISSDVLQKYLSSCSFARWEALQKILELLISEDCLDIEGHIPSNDPRSSFRTKPPLSERLSFVMKKYYKTHRSFFFVTGGL